MSASQLIWTVAFSLLGAWAAYTGSHWYSPKRRWAPARKWIFALDVALVASCALAVAGLVTHRFRAWMFAPFGTIYAVALFLPCYFVVVDRVRSVRVIRNVVFVLIAALCFAVALGLLPMTYVGLS